MNKLKEINGKYYQEVEVVMLATDKATWPNCIWLGRISNQLRLDTSYNNNSKSIPPIDNSMLPQHLYFLSNEKIKKPCWCINKNRDTVYFIQDNFETANEDWDKIIATTNKSIQALKFIGTKLEAFSKILKGVKAQPSKEFIQAYIKAYNENKSITKVLVEYDVITLNEDWSKKPVVVTNEYKLKVNSSNEITIKKVKNSWTREEVIELFKQFYTEFASYPTIHLLVRDKWIEENL